MERKQFTLTDLKSRPINKRTAERMERTLELSEYNICVYRHRMTDELKLKWNIHDMTHEGNNKKDNERMLDDARMYYEKKVYTDEEWETYFLPAINEMMLYNDTFVRWEPGYLVKNKETGRKYIVEYDYTRGFCKCCGYSRMYEDLALCGLDKEGNVEGSSAWHNYNNYELVDTEHTEENITKVRAYNNEHGNTPPYYLDRNLSQMFYGMDSSAAPMWKQ